MKNILTIIAVICIAAGCVVGHFSTIAIVDYGAIALEAFGLCTLIMQTLQKTKDKTWKEYICVGFFVMAGVLCAIAGIAEATMTQLITVIAGLISLIAGLIIAKVKNE